MSTIDILQITLLATVIVWIIVSEVAHGRRHSRVLATMRAEIHSLRTRLNAYGPSESIRKE